MDSNTIQQLLETVACNTTGAAPLLRETHISWVILCGEFAYKIKKPVNFGFLDFSSIEQRQHFCEQELLLNRRFAPELYLSVVPISSGPGGVQFDGSGTVIDHAVKMCRFDERKLLSEVAARGELDRPLVRALGRELASQHSTAQHCQPGSPATLLAAMVQNFKQVRDYSLEQEHSDTLDEVETWTLRRQAELLSIMEQRERDGHVIDGHGDAHLGNIVLIDGAVRLFDCIEFNPSLRIMDSIAEIAFLTMDLEARGHHQESHWVLGDYLEYSGDYAGLALLDLYSSYFAMVRAKVALLREPPAHEDITATPAYADCCRYLSLAQQYCQRPARFLAITHGVSGSGKSTVADKLVAAGGAIRIRSDVERKRLFGLAPEQRSDPADEAQLYSSAMSRRTFTRLEQLAGEILAAGFAVIVDATFLHRRSRDQFHTLATSLALPFIIIDCVAPAEQMRERLRERERHGQDASEAGVQVMENQLANAQPLGAGELQYRFEADSAEDGAVLWQGMADELELRGPH